MTASSGKTRLSVSAKFWGGFRCPNKSAIIVGILMPVFYSTPLDGEMIDASVSLH